MKRCVIVGGAGISDYSAAKACLSDNDFYIFCDSGLSHEDALNVTPDLIVGDFDSHKAPDRDIETIVLPREKDDTDTFFAIKEAIARGFSDFLIIGACGGRLDHTLGNISILLYLHKRGLNGKIVDDFSEMEIVAQKPKYIDDTYPFFSVINIDGTPHGITIKNAKFPLQNAEIFCDYQYGISNEVLKGNRAEVSVSNGAALLIRVRKA